MRLLDTNQFLEECRKAWKNSPAHRAMQEGRPIRQSVAATLPAREPGTDDEPLALGIARDPLEQEFLDRSQP